MHCIETTLPMRRPPLVRRLGGLVAPALSALALALAGCATREPMPSPAAAAAPRYVELPAPPVARSWEELKVNAARRLVAAHPDTSYMGVPPEPLLGIPVLEIELHADGSVRGIKVLREPREAKETI
ncbi:MAG TPA: hypothetical protein VLM87_14250, partial [Rubrivivax sp.]|nr:hypothetical protein [Rubrivivax sp.]